MSKQTAHERYEDQVKNDIRRPYDDAQMAAKQKQIDGLVAERRALMAQIDGLIDERTVLREKLTAARATADKWRRAYIGEIPGEATTALVCDACEREFAGAFNSQAWYVCHLCGGDLWHKRQSPGGESTVDGGSNA